MLFKCGSITIGKGNPSWGAPEQEVYFGFSRSWIYQRLNGYDGNGNACEFTDDQKETLRAALRDIARRLNETADNL